MTRKQNISIRAGRSWALKSARVVRIQSRIAGHCLRLIVATLLCPIAGQAQDAPLWVKLVHWISVKTDATDVPIMTMGPHMQMSLKSLLKPGDKERAEAIMRQAHDVLLRYPTVEAAKKDGYKPFHEVNQLDEEIHFTSFKYAGSEGKRIDYAHPGSILFKRTRSGLVPVGVMYSANGDAKTAELDMRVPLSFASWHRHVDLCFTSDKRMIEPRAAALFGFEGSLHTEATCEAAKGYWVPVAFG